MGSIAIAGSGGPGSIVIGTTTTSGGTDTCILFDKAGVVGEDPVFVWNYTNHLFTFGMAGGNQLISGFNTRMQVLNPNNNDFDFSTITYGGGGVGGWNSCTSRGTGPGNSVATIFGEFLFFLSGNGDDGTGGFQTGAAFFANAAGTYSPTSAPGTLTFATCAVGSIHLVSRIACDETGVVALAQDPTAPPGKLYIYNVADGLSHPVNFERATFDWTTTSNVLTIGTQKGGTGSTRNIQFVAGGTNVLDWNITASNTWTAGPVTATNAFQAAYFAAIATTGNVPGLYVQLNTDAIPSSRVACALDANDRGSVRFGPGGVSATPPDVYLERYGTGLLGLSRAATGAAGFQVYNVIDTLGNPTNYERGVFDWTTTANVLTIGTQAGGTGTVRDIAFVTGTTATPERRMRIVGGDDNDFRLAFDNAGGRYTGVYFENNGTAKAQFGWDNNVTALLITSTVANGSVNLAGGSSGNAVFAVGTSTIGMPSDVGLAWSSTNLAANTPLTTPDTGISRVAPVSSVPTVAFGNSTVGDASATIKAKTKAGAPTATDVPAGTWVLIRDTTNATTKLYYNNAGTLQTVALV